MMSWRDEYQDPMYNGVAFDYHGGWIKVGRMGRVVVLPAPGKKKSPDPIPQDLGLDVREVFLRCSLSEPNVFKKRAAMMAAFEKPGIGELKHPTLRKTLKVVTYDRPTFGEDVDKRGGEVTFSMKFTVVGPRESSEISYTDFRARLKNKSAFAVAAAVNDFVDKFDVGGVTSFVAQGARLTMANLSGSLTALARPLVAVDNLGASLTASLATFDGALTNLVQLPSELASTYKGLFDQIRDTLGIGKTTVDLYKSQFGAGASLPPVDVATEQRRREAQNRAAALHFNRRLAIAFAAETAADVGYETLTDAIGDRDEMAGLCGDVLYDVEPDDAGNDVAIAADVYSAFRDLRVAIHEHMTEVAASLPELVDYTPGVTQPAVVVAQRLYGDGRRWQEIVERNGIPHPLFVTGGQALKVVASE